MIRYLIPSASRRLPIAIRRPPLAGLLAACLAAAAIACPAPARADDIGYIDVQLFRPAIDSKGYITVNASQILGRNELSFGLITNWGHNVLRLDGNGRVFRVANIVTPQLQVAYGVLRWLELGLGLPITVVSVDSDAEGEAAAKEPGSQQGVGDLAFHPKVRFLNTSQHRVGLAAVASLVFPTGRKMFLGEKQVIFQPQVIVDKEWLGSRLRAAANLGFRIRPSRRMYDDPWTGQRVEVGPEMLWGLGVSYAVVPQRFDLLGEFFGAVPLGTSTRGVPAEFSAGMRLYLARSSFFMLGGGVGLDAHYGAPDGRVFLGFTFEPMVGDRDGDGIKDDVDKCPDDPEDRDGFEDQDGCPDPDNDRDGLLDPVDRCPNEPETKNGLEDTDGCPDSAETDRDTDGLADERDGCPDEPEDRDGFEDTDGCPDVDNDQDGIPDVRDRCPDEPEDKDGFEDEDGCPDPDNDRDRILDVVDKCPNEPETYNGFEDQDGCPDRGQVVVRQDKIEILDKIYFETDKAIIKSISFPLLDAVVATFKANPDIARVEIQGHADERGNAAYNLRLTEERAQAVRQYLIDRGVAAERLLAKGYGKTRPIDPRHNEEAWSANRRVDFVILERTKAEAPRTPPGPALPQAPAPSPTAPKTPPAP